VEFLRQNPIAGTMYNPYEWGGYFIWKLYPQYRVFIDGRANTVYSEEIYRDSLVSMSGDSGWDKILDKYGINFVLCNKILRETNGHFLPDRMKKDPGWVLIYEDEIELLFVRNNSANKEIIEKSKKETLNYPVTPYRLNGLAVNQLKKGDYDGAQELLSIAVSINPDYEPALVNLGYVYLSRGDKKKAVEIYNRVLSIDSLAWGVHFNLGLMYEKDGDSKRAMENYKKEIKANPGNLEAQKRLKNLEGR
jgi:tetratricopeptide (TPR) repeat protein